MDELKPRVRGGQWVKGRSSCSLIGDKPVIVCLSLG